MGQGFDAFDRYQMKQTLLSAIRSGHTLRHFFPVVRAQGDLPQGTVGRVIYGQLEWEAEHFAEEVSKILEGESADNLAIDLIVDGFKLVGLITGLYPHGRVQIRFARRTAKDWLSVWINHIVLCALKRKDHRPASILLDSDGTAFFNPVKHPEKYLKNLVEIYQEGLCRPLHFFPELSLRYIQMVTSETKEPVDALRSIRNLWVGSDFKKGFSEDPYYRRCFGETDPIDEEFKNLAEVVFIPILRSAGGLS